VVRLAGGGEPDCPKGRKSTAITARPVKRVVAVALGTVVAVGAGLSVLAALDSTDASRSPHVGIPATASRGAIQRPAREVLARDPYMGVSCRIPNSIRCDRVGLAVWLRRPALAISATIAGAPVKLDDHQWSGPSRHGWRTLFAGFLRPAGITSRLHVTPDPGSPTTWEATSAFPAVAPPPALVRLRIDYGHGRVVVTQTSVDLHAGWG
jgi:hypothetical protein